MPSTFVITPSNDSVSTKPSTRFSIKTVAGIAFMILGVGFAAGYVVKSEILGPNKSLTDRKSSSTCVGDAWLGKVSLAASAAVKENATGLYSDVDVREHAAFELNTTGLQFASNTKTTFACVDARGLTPSLGTPGGDLGEFASALTVYFKSAKVTPTLPLIRNFFDEFMKHEISEDRPFYFHTDDNLLKRVFAKVEVALKRSVKVLPAVTPPEQEKKVWLDELTKPEVQGCGHIRLMMTTPSLYALEDSFVIKSVIQVFYEKWWSASKDRKRKFRFSVKAGPLVGKAIAIVSNAGSKCPGSSPKVTPSQGGSTLFVYHAEAVADFRKKVLTPFFQKLAPGKTLVAESFVTSLTDLNTKQLTATLTNLSPANAVDLFSLPIMIK